MLTHHCNPGQRAKYLALFSRTIAPISLKKFPLLRLLILAKASFSRISLHCVALHA